ncbi:hypothetical protein BDV96DRAFT_572832 [Lophiotrema nucula]|uniref:Uncharacterized protein n=1 Tax=Lophiotrema nucula TaxID=690887 RepID=A0A6A5ZE86_9PLEO|nr:hypothetical protein BDV96DRAFT_572832 [Lophiotrema nucula]
MRLRIKVPVPSVIESWIWDLVWISDLEVLLYLIFPIKTLPKRKTSCMNAACRLW